MSQRDGCSPIRTPSARARAFTLIELLVVIAIIALLISILLPGLGAAREAGRRIVCASTLRQLATAINTYGNDWKEAIPGSPTTSGAEALKGNFNGTAIQTWDWCGPLASMMGLTAPGDGYSTSELNEETRAARFDYYRNSKAFQCASNNILAVAYPNPDDPIWKSGRMMSFNMSTQFVSTEERDPAGTNPRTPRIDRRGYQPSLHRVGTASMKVAFYDAHRYAEAIGALAGKPDYDPRINAGFGGAFSDTGPWFIGSTPNRSLDRRLAPGEGFGSLPIQSVDVRYYAFRHGSKPRSSSGSGGGAQCLGNMAFFDGHVKLYDDLTATDPDLWFPTGTRLNGGGSRLETWKTTKARFPSKTGEAGVYDVP